MLEIACHRPGMVHVAFLFVDQLIAEDGSYGAVCNRAVVDLLMAQGALPIFGEYAREQCFTLVRIVEPGRQFLAEGGE